MSQPLTLQDLEPTGYSLTSTLNQLLASLHLHFVLETPADLTPSMLLGILECILQSRLPIPPAIRESRSDSAKVEAMKVFLGVLETDIIQTDVGLSKVDPRNLAAGEWDEVVYVGELLCWFGRVSGILPADAPGDKRCQPGYEDDEDEPEDVFGKARDNTVSSGHSNSRDNAGSPSTRSSLTDSAHTALSMLNASNGRSDTTVMSVSFDNTRLISPPATPQLVQLSHRAEGQDELIADTKLRRPYCIHQLEDETLLRALQDASLDETAELDSEADFSTSSCDCPTGISGNSPAPVRYTGWLEQVDNDLEIKSFEANRRNRALNNNNESKSQSYSALGRSAGRSFSVPSTNSNLLSRSEGSYLGSQGVLTRHNSPTEYTLALMNERAKLLTELASLNTAMRRRR